MKMLKDESGQAMILTLLCMTCLLGFVGFAVDVGVLLNAKRQMQTAADGAAIAGALEQSYTDMTTSADAAAALNGVTVGVNGGAVTINTPPLSGAYVGKAGYVEAIVSQNQPTFFMRMFNFASMTVSARAVATLGSGTTCVLTLGSGGTGFLMNGSGDWTTLGCSIVDDSSGTPAFEVNGSNTLDAASIGVVGSSLINGSNHVPNLPVTGIPPAPNPLAYLSPPSFNTSGCAANPNINSGIRSSYGNGTTFTIPPGCYNGLTINGSPTVTFSPGNYTINGAFTVNGSGTVSLGAGLYETNGALLFNGSGTISGTDVTIYTTNNGSVTVNGSQKLDLTAPTSGAENGILFYQNPSDTQQATINGSNNSTLEGIIYMPGANLTMNGSGSGTFYADIVTSSLTFNGSGTLQNYALINSSSLLTAARLVE